MVLPSTLQRFRRACAPLTLFSPERQAILLYFFQCPGIQSSLCWSKPAPQMGSISPLRAPFGSLPHAQGSLLNWDIKDFLLASLHQQPDCGARIAPQFLKAPQRCCFSLWLLRSVGGKDPDKP